MKTQTQEDTDTGRTVSDSRGSGWGDAPTNQGRPRIAGKHREQRSKEGVCPTGYWRQHNPDDTLISDFQPPEL